MSIAIEEDHLALLASARRFTERRCPPAVVRAAVEAEADALPPFWSDLAGLGWLGLAVAEADGGEGYGYTELAVVLEELGRTVAPGPMLPTAWAAAVVGLAAGSRSGEGPSGLAAGAGEGALGLAAGAGEGALGLAAGAEEGRLGPAGGRRSGALGDLAAGRRVGTVALGGSIDGVLDDVTGEGLGSDRRRTSGAGSVAEQRIQHPESVRSDHRAAGVGLRLTGSTGPVLCGVLADVVVVPATVDGDEVWAVVGRDAVTATPLDSLDATRRLARLEMADAPAMLLAGVGRARVEAVGVALAAAECAGGAAWCVETAAAYARDRRQFGRPIGQFQAVKHRCADMLVRLEQARAVAADAAAALDGQGPDGAGGPDTSGGAGVAGGAGGPDTSGGAGVPHGAGVPDTSGGAGGQDRSGGPEGAEQSGGVGSPGAGLAVAAAGAIAFEAFAAVAKDCIQVLGGIGFTWEHDAHLYLRRALALRQLFGGAGPWREAAARAALGGARRRLGLELPAEAEARRPEVRATVEGIAALPKDERRRRLADTGLLVPHWAPPWGRDAGAVEQLVIDQELRRCQVRVPHLMVGAWAAPTIAVHGTPEQQERWVRPTLYGEVTWCQLFSEPEAGSDLASLTTRASRVEGGWRLDGQKVWTTMAAEADWGICLARTNPAAPKHLGITYFVVDMSAPGIDVRPLRELTGLAMFNEVFLDGVFVPDDCVIGDVDGGWPLARTTLANERVSMGSGSSFGGGIEALVGLVAERTGTGELTADARLLDDLGALVAEAHSLAAIGLRATARSLTGAAPGPEASVRKLLGAEHDQRTQELGLQLLGPEGATTVGAAGQWTFGFLANRCLTIAGGTSEIQRNVIGERLLGLPRDPEPAV